MGDSSKINNIYLSPDHNILPKSGEVKDLGILMSENCDFDRHIIISSQEMLQTMWLDLANLFNLFEISIANPFQVNSVTVPHLDYGSQLWSPYKVKNINALEKVQRVFTKHTDGMHNLS